jgi:thymidylate synthase (FAD)
MASDQMVIQAARVSTASKVTIGDTFEAKDVGLINYLMRDRHGSPFEHNAFTFYIEAPLFVFREFQRHRIASYNEESGRYKKLEPVFYVPPIYRKLIQVGKAGAYTFEEGTAKQYLATQDTLIDNSAQAFSRYEQLLEQGVAREVARMVLPLNIYSSMYVTMNARSLMNFLSLRSLEQGTYPSFPQVEISWVADEMEAIFARKMQITYKAFIENGRVAP